MMAAIGTKRTWRDVRLESAFGGRADVICSERVFPVLTQSGIDNHGALTICLHAGGKPASVSAGFGLRGGGCRVDSLNQKLSSLSQPSLGSGSAGGLHSALSAGQAI